jgi:hypothetical protein
MYLQERGRTMNFYRFLNSQTKAIIVLEGLAGKPLKEICLEYNISAVQYLRWRKTFLQYSPRVFDGDFEDLYKRRTGLQAAIGAIGKYVSTTLQAL